tara:strand:- start:1007 stop:1360 length:354 start_codon:yes stop_codon:yes gene_type:complete
MAQYEEFTISQGTDVSIEIHCEDGSGNKKDLSNYVVTANLKKNYSSTTSTTFVSNISSPPTDGKLTLTLTNAQTAALEKGRYVYDVDIQFVDGNANTIIERILEGRVQVTPKVGSGA